MKRLFIILLFGGFLLWAACCSNPVDSGWQHPDTGTCHDCHGPTDTIPFPPIDPDDDDVRAL